MGFDSWMAGEDGKNQRGAISEQIIYKDHGQAQPFCHVMINDNFNKLFSLI